jgi:hypothetical protein
MLAKGQPVIGAMQRLWAYIPHIGRGIFPQFPSLGRKFSGVGAVLGERDPEELKYLDL